MFVLQALGQTGTAPEECTPDILRLVIRSHLESPAMWAIFPLQDLMPLSKAVPFRPAREETINDPTNPKHYWRYRMHVPLEDLINDTDFIAEMQAALYGESTLNLQPAAKHASLYLASSMPHFQEV